MTDHALIDRFRQARRDQTLVVLDGLHAVKHAMRFGAEIEISVAYDTDAVRLLAADVAPDVCARLTGGLTSVSREDYRQLSPVPPDTGIIAIARRPVVSPGDILRGPLDSPVVLLENPRNPFNIGATVRVAAAGRRGGCAGNRSAGPMASGGDRFSSGLTVRATRCPYRQFPCLQTRGPGHRPARRTDALA